MKDKLISAAFLLILMSSCFEEEESEHTHSESEFVDIFVTGCQYAGKKHIQPAKCEVYLCCDPTTRTIYQSWQQV